MFQIQGSLSIEIGQYRTKYPKNTELRQTGAGSKFKPFLKWDKRAWVWLAPGPYKPHQVLYRRDPSF